VSIHNAFKYTDYALKALDLVEGAINMSEQDDKGRTLIEEIELEGRQLVDRVKELIQEGNVRRLIIKDADGKFLLEIPLTVGVVAGGAFVLAAPVLAALGALAALMTRVKVEVIREEDGGKE
jgi:hypothetical protein